MSAPKLLTTQKVCAVLRKAGFEHSKRSATRVRGWGSWSPGYRVQRDVRKDGVVQVWHNVYGLAITARDREQQDREATLYEAALTAAGLSVERDGHQLSVTAPTPAADPHEVTEHQTSKKEA